MDIENEIETELTDVATPNVEAEIPVRYEIGGKVIDISKMNRALRLLFGSQTKKLRKKFKHLKGVVDDQGRHATIVIRQPIPGKPAIESVIEYPEAFSESVDGSDKAVRVA